jgi:predicted ArsR family transcriptional regulator
MRKTQILEVLEQGPATSTDVAAELGISVQLASSHLHNLFKRGCVKTVSTLPSSKATGGRPQRVFGTLETPA